MKKMFLLFSHKLTEKQKEDATKVFNIDEFVYLPDNLQKLWSNVPAELENLVKYSLEFRNFLKYNAKNGDVVLIQGDFGLTCIMVEFAKKIGLTPVYSTTERIVTEKIVDGKVEKTSKFGHVRFRKY